MNDELTRCNKPEHWDEPNPCTLCLLTQEDVSNILRLLREKLSIEFWPGLTNLQLHITALRAQLAQAQEQVNRLTTDIEQGFMAGAYARLKHLQEAEAKLAAMEKELHDAKTQCGKNAISHMTQYHRADDLQQQLATATAERDGAEGRRKECERQYQLSMTVKNRQIDDARAAVVELAEMVMRYIGPERADYQRAVELKQQAQG